MSLGFQDAGVGKPHVVHGPSPKDFRSFRLWVVMSADGKFVREVPNVPDASACRSVANGFRCARRRRLQCPALAALVAGVLAAVASLCT